MNAKRVTERVQGYTRAKTGDKVHVELNGRKRGGCKPVYHQNVYKSYIVVGVSARLPYWPCSLVGLQSRDGSRKLLLIGYFESGKF